MCLAQQRLLGLQNSPLGRNCEIGQRNRHAHRHGTDCRVKAATEAGWLADEVFAIAEQTRVSSAVWDPFLYSDSKHSRMLPNEMNPRHPSPIVTRKEVAIVSGT